jgi:hypothetical protein
VVPAAAALAGPRSQQPHGQHQLSNWVRAISFGCATWLVSWYMNAWLRAVFISCALGEEVCC